MHHLIACAVAAATHAQSAPPVYQDSINLRNVTMAVHAYHQQHGTFPATIGDTFASVQNLGAYVSALDQLPDDAPDDPVAWINANASFDYLPHAGLDMNEIPEWNDVVIAHLDLTAGHPTEPTPDNPEGAHFPVAFLDGHVEVLPFAEAKRRIDDSAQLFDGLATGGPVPERFQVILDMRAVSKALRAYADDNQGTLPPTLGPLIDYVPDTNRTQTPRDKAAVFLSPARAGKTFIPEQPTAEWVDQNTSLTYLGNDTLFMSWIEDPARLILIHADEPTEIGGTDLVTIATVNGRVSNEPVDYAEAIADESTSVINALARTERLPDLQHTMRDLRLIAEAALAYTRDHDDTLPATLGPLLDYIPDDQLTDAYAPLTPQQRALVFISPSDESGIVPPQQPTPEWVDAKASYVWLGGGLDLRRLRAQGVMCLMHAPLAHPLDGAARHEIDGYVPFVDTVGNVIPAPRSATEMTATESARIIEQMRARR